MSMQLFNLSNNSRLGLKPCVTAFIYWGLRAGESFRSKKSILVTFNCLHVYMTIAAFLVVCRNAAATLSTSTHV
jgi:hypothetical protein